MKRSPGFPVLLLLLLAAASCTRVQEKPSPVAAVQPVAQSAEPEANPEPGKGSWALEVENPSFGLQTTLHPPRPFPSSVVIGASTVTFAWEDGRTYSTSFDGTPVELPSAPLLTLTAGMTGATRGKLIYAVQGAILSVSGGKALPSPWTAPFPIDAPPVLAGSKIIVATGRPSFFLLDRKTLTPIAEYPVAARISGPVAILESGKLLLAGHADGSFGLYSLAPPSASLPDPALLLTPSPERLDGIRAKVQELLGGVSMPGALVVRPCTARSRVSGTGPWLFLVESISDDWIRIGLEGLKEDFLLAFFDADGAFLESNLDYSAERHLDLKAAKGQFYYAAVAIKGSEAPAAARFVVGKR